MPEQGYFITFEGPEGGGKSVQSQRLAAFLESRGYAVVWTREPGGTALGTYLRQALLHLEDRPTAWAEVFLFLADRAQHVETVIRPALQAGKVVLCDRYADSTLAYQGYGRGLPLDVLRYLNDLATGGLVPHLTVLLDVDVETGLRRRQAQGREWNHIDAETLAFHRRVREGYLQLARQDPARWVVFSTQDRDEEAVQAALREVVLARLAQAFPAFPPRA